MENLKPILSWVLQNLKKIRKYIFLVLCLTVVFYVFIFPFDDLSEWISRKVQEVSQNQLMVSFSKVHLQWVPLGLNLEQMRLQMQGLPPLNIADLAISPGIKMLLTQNPSGSLKAAGIFHGQIQIQLSNQGPSAEPTYDLKLQMDQISLEEVRNFLQGLANHPKLGMSLAPILRATQNLKGGWSGFFNGTLDTSGKKQPLLNTEIKLSKFELPSNEISTALGPINLPELQFSQVVLKAKMSEGRLELQEVTLGNESDDISGTIRGFFMMTAQKSTALQVVPGAYQLEFNLSVKKTFAERATLIMTFLDQYKKPAGDIFQVGFKLTGANFQSNPQFSALQ